MLGRLLELIKSNHGAISEEALCETLDISPEMLQGMLSSLVRMGYLEEVVENKPASCLTCKDCIIQQQCALVSLFKEKRYQVVNSIRQTKRLDVMEV
jgi:hypothetical protein